MELPSELHADAVVARMATDNQCLAQDELKKLQVEMVHQLKVALSFPIKVETTSYHYLQHVQESDWEQLFERFERAGYECKRTWLSIWISVCDKNKK